MSPPHTHPHPHHDAMLLSPSTFSAGVERSARREGERELLVIRHLVGASLDHVPGRYTSEEGHMALLHS